MHKIPKRRNRKNNYFENRSLIYKTGFMIWDCPNMWKLSTRWSTTNV